MNSDVWEIVKKDDGTFDLFRNGGLLHGTIPEGWLADQLGQYGFCGQEYADIPSPTGRSGKSEDDPYRPNQVKPIGKVKLHPIGIINSLEQSPLQDRS